MKKLNLLVLACTVISLTFIGCKKESLSTAVSTNNDVARKPTGGTASAPVVSFISPVNGDIVTGIINVQIAASSAIGITNTSLMQTVGTFNCFYGNDNTAPYAYSWNTDYICLTKILSGQKITLRATATDAAGKITYTDIVVTKK